MGTSDFKKINKTNLSDQIIEQIKFMIDQEVLKPGDQLPSERELAVMLDVSRLPLREALKALQATNVLESQYGDGYYVRGLEIAALIDLFSNVANNLHDVLADLKEARLIVEVSAVKLSCLRRTDDDLLKMENAILTMKEALQAKDHLAIMKSSLDFHKKMIYAAHNLMIEKMMDCISGVLLEGRIKSMNVDSQRYKRSLSEHREILEAIRRQDVESAQRLLEYHLTTSY